MNDLHLQFKLVNLRLHQLLGDLRQELEVKLDETTLHDLLSELNGLLFALFHDLPQFVRELVCALVQLLLRLVIFAQVGVLVGECVESLDEFIEDGLFALRRVQELQEGSLQLARALTGLLALEADVAEGAAHLPLVVAGKLAPHLNNHRLEVSV